VIIDALQQEAHEHEAATAIIRDRLEIAENQLKNFISQRERLLNLYLHGDFPKDLLDEKMAEIKQTIGKFETEAVSLRDQLNRTTPSTTDIENIKKFCEEVQGGLDEFSFEDKQMIIESLNVTAMVTRDENGIRLALSGYFPTITTGTIDHKTSSCFVPLKVRPTSCVYLVKVEQYCQPTRNGIT
jgi:hypothetical protein